MQCTHHAAKAHESLDCVAEYALADDLTVRKSMEFKLTDSIPLWPLHSMVHAGPGQESGGHGDSLSRVQVRLEG